METIGSRMKKIRLEKRMHQSFVARILNISIPGYSKIENNLTDSSIKRVQQIADIFNVHIKILMEDDPETKHGTLKLALENKLAEHDDYLAILKTQLIVLYEELRQVEMVVP